MKTKGPGHTGQDDIQGDDMKGWHFLARDKKLGHCDGREVKLGEWLEVNGRPNLCEYGLHASVRVIDALKCARNSQLIACRVEVDGDIDTGADQFCGRRRRVLAWVNCEKTLHRFAVWCARRALEQAQVTDERCYTALDVKERWVEDKATDRELAAARVAAWEAAWEAARGAARGAAWGAAWLAARDAARGAAREAAWEAAWEAAVDTVWGAARDTAWTIQNRQLAEMLDKEIEENGEAYEDPQNAA